MSKTQKVCVTAGRKTGLFLQYFSVVKKNIARRRADESEVGMGRQLASKKSIHDLVVVNFNAYLQSYPTKGRQTSTFFGA